MAADFIHIDVNDSRKIAFYQIDMLLSDEQDRFADIFIFTDTEGVDIGFNTNGSVKISDLSLSASFSREYVLNIIDRIIDNAYWCISKLLDPACMLTHPDEIFIRDNNDPSVIGKIIMKYLPVRIPEHISNARLSDEFIDFARLLISDRALTSGEIDLLRSMDLYDPDECKSLLKRIRDIKTVEHKTSVRRSSALSIHPAVSIFILIFSQLLIISASLYLLINLESFESSGPALSMIIVMLVLLFAADVLAVSDRSSPIRKLITDISDKKNSYKTDGRSEHSTEKTVLLDNGKEKNRIAMLCAGVPGTAEEGRSHKGFVLSDDFLIGRDGSKVDFKIEGSSVGRSHARIIRRQNTFFIEDLGSHNGTLVDGKRLKKGQEYVLPDDCLISFADKEYYFSAT